MTRPHIVVLHRWRGDYALYANYVAHADHTVTYVTTDAGLNSVPAQAAEAIVLSTLEDPEPVHAAVEALVTRHGKPAGIVALKEDDLLTAAVLRERWNCPGPRGRETVLFRDKYLMCSVVADAGCRVPPFSTVTDHAGIRAFAAEHGWPVVVKPRTAHSSQGVVKIDEEAGLATLGIDPSRSVLVQRFNPHPLYYVDGVLREGTLGPWTASRYLNSCLAFRGGTFVGAVEEDDPSILAAIERDTLDFLSALSPGPLVFHLELFVEPTPSGPTCSFLEVGARAGGAEIPYLWRQLHGYDLMHAVADVQLGRPPGPAPTGRDRVIAGLLLVPAPAARPCRITAITPMVGRDPGPYDEVVTAVGEIVPAGESVFEQVAGRFRFRGRSTAEVEAAVVATHAGFRVEAEAL